MSDAKTRRRLLRRLRWTEGDIAVLENALALLKEGWVGRFPRLDYEVCAYTALTAVTGGSVPMTLRIGGMILKEANRAHSNGTNCFSDIPTWNDWPGRTKLEVFRVFKRVRDNLRATLPGGIQ